MWGGIKEAVRYHGTGDIFVGLLVCTIQGTVVVNSRRRAAAILIPVFIVLNYLDCSRSSSSCPDQRDDGALIEVETKLTVTPYSTAAA